MKLEERRWYRELTEIGERLAERTGLGAEAGFRLLKMALAWRLLAEAGLPVWAATWPARWEMARAQGGGIFAYPRDWDAKMLPCVALLDPMMDCPIPVPLEQSLAFVHQLILDRQGEGRQRARRTTGSYYTPSVIVDRLLKETLDDWISGWRQRWAVANPHQRQSLRSELAALRVLDPSCGAGAFLLAAWGRLITCWQAVDDPTPTRTALQNLCGWEQDEAAVQILTVIVAARLYAAGDHGPQVTLKVIVGDYLRYVPSAEEQMAIIVGNPPWVRAKYSLSGANNERKGQLAALRRQFPELAVGELNLYTLFVSRALDWLLPGGRLAFIVPNSFLLDHNSEGLRRRLLTSYRIRRIAHLTEREGRQLFAGVSQASVLLFVERIGANANVDHSHFEDQERWLGLPYALMVTGSAAEMSLLHRLLSIPTLSGRFVVQDGELHLTRGKKWICDQGGDGLMPLVRGDDLARNPTAVRDHVRLSAPLRERWRGLIDGRRILLQRIANQHLKRRLKGAVVQGVVAANSTVAIIPKDDLADQLLSPTLKLIHSDLYHWLLSKLSSDNNIPAWKLKILPWLPPYALDAEVDRTAINRLVYQLYGLSSEERQIIENPAGTAENHA
ncbi:MAG: HsdM family class I SAM-dependent methyltransferase [Bacillota bacterium]